MLDAHEALEIALRDLDWRVRLDETGFDRFEHRLVERPECDRRGAKSTAVLDVEFDHVVAVRVFVGRYADLLTAVRVLKNRWDDAASDRGRPVAV